MGIPPWSNFAFFAIGDSFCDFLKIASMDSIAFHNRESSLKGLLHYFFTFFQKYFCLTDIYEKKRLLKTPSKNSNPNCNYWPLKFMQIRF